MQAALPLAAIVFILLVLPPAAALNCTHLEGEYHLLCGAVYALDIDEEEKEALMSPTLYGSSRQTQAPINLEVPIIAQEVTADELYENNLQTVFKISLFFLIHYIIYSFATKSSLILKWLTVDSLT